MAIVGVGVFLTSEDVKELRTLQFMPFITGPALRGPETVEEALYRIALKKGLPQISGYYGLDQTKSPPEITKWVPDEVSP